MIVSEIGGNNSAYWAQDLTPYFSKDYYPYIEQSIYVPNVTVLGRGDWATDWFKFKVAQGSNTIIDIDFGMPDFNPSLRVYDSNGNPVGSSDDYNYADAGSSDFRDPIIRGYLARGEYYVQVLRDPHPAYGGPDIPYGADYRLTISVQYPGQWNTPPANSAPVANADSATVGEDSAVSVYVIGNDTDANGDALSVTSASLASGQGSVSVSGGTITYSTNGAYNSLAAGQAATVKVNYGISDGKGGTASSTATITVQGANDAPTAAAVSLAVAEDGPAVTRAFAADDIDSDDSAATLSYSLTGQPQDGSVVLNGDGTFTVDPGAGFQSLSAGETKTFTFGYTATDRHGASAQATASVTVTGANDAPTAGAVSLAATEDGGPVSGTLAGDDIDGDDTPDSLTYSLIGQLQEGTVTLDGAGGFSFDPGAAFQSLGAGETTVLTFGYQVTDRHGASAQATASITVTGVNDGPVAQADSASVGENESVVIAALANDTDADVNDVLRIVSIDPGARGSVSIAGDGASLVYTADADEFDLLATGATATDTVTYVVEDSAGARSTATLKVTVTGRDDGSLIIGTNKPDDLAGAAGEDTIIGDNSTDQLTGGAGADVIYGENGIDTLSGGAGIDRLFGGNGDDRLDGGAGADWLVGDHGDDVLTGGAGADAFVAGKACGNDLITDFLLDHDRIVLEDGARIVGVREVCLYGGGAADATQLQLSSGTVTLLGVTGVNDWTRLLTA